MRCIASLLLLTVAFASSASATRRPDEISPATIRLIERQVVMPAGAEPLHAYDRYYKRTLFKDVGRRAIEGRFMLRRAFAGAWRDESIPVSGIPGAFISSGKFLPNVADGGCAVVTIYFDVASARLAEIKEEGEDATALAICNGLA